MPEQKSEHYLILLTYTGDLDKDRSFAIKTDGTFELDGEQTKDLNRIQTHVRLIYRLLFGESEDSSDESQAVSAVEGAPLTGRALEQAATKFIEQLTWAIYGDLHMERTVKEIREEHEAAWPPEVATYVRAEFAKQGSKF